MWIVPLSFSGLQSRRSQVVEGECGSKDQPAFEMGNAGGFRLIWEHQGTFVVWLRSPGLGASWEQGDDLGSCCLSCQAGARSRSWGCLPKRKAFHCSPQGMLFIFLSPHTAEPGQAEFSGPPQLRTNFCVKLRMPDPGR